MPVSDDDKPALAALLQRYTRWWRERDRDLKLKEKLDARIEKYPEQLTQLKAAFGLFGVTGFAHGDWQNLRKDLGDDIYIAALKKVPHIIPLPELEDLTPKEAPEPEILVDYDDEESDQEVVVDGENVWENLVDFDLDDLIPKPDKDATVREITLIKLKDAGTNGAKAADIRKFIEKLRGAPLHEKTVGMTLYRLSQEGAARREGRTWFFVPPLEDETKNPGGDTPGLINRDNEEGEEL